MSQANLFDLLDLLVEATDHLVGGVGHLLHHHQAHQGVHLAADINRKLKNPRLQLGMNCKQLYRYRKYYSSPCLAKSYARCNCRSSTPP